MTASYGYDALDRRMQKTNAGTTTRFLHAGSDEIAEYSSAGALLRRYVPGPGTDERAALIDSGLLSPPATSIKYPHTDRQGSVMAVTDSTGAVTERFAYDGFGRSNSSLSGYPFRYTGQRLDFESGLMFYKARVYSQALGRFLQTDPIGTKDDLNLYAYIGNDPVNGTDPTGKCSSCPADELIDYNQFANDRRDAGNAFAAEGWQWLKENHPVGAPARTYDAIVNQDWESAAWSVGTAGAGKALGWAAQGLSSGFNWARRAWNAACCFAAGTPVATKDGLRPIEQIKIGDFVLSRDEKTGETAYKRVTALIPKHDRIIWTVTLSIASAKPGGAAKQITYQTTDDHPWRLATGVWVQTNELGRGMRILRADGVAADIVAIRDTGKPGAVYNLEVADFHTYFVGEERAWVHNACLASKFLVGGKGYASFDAFKRAAGSAHAGHRWHHIVEQRNAGKFGAESIHNTNNLVEVPYGVHQDISAYYSSVQEFSNGQTVRSWLNSKSFDEQYEFGMGVLRQYGVIH